MQALPADETVYEPAGSRADLPQRDKTPTAPSASLGRSAPRWQPGSSRRRSPRADQSCAILPSPKVPPILVTWLASDTAHSPRWGGIFRGRAATSTGPHRWIEAKRARPRTAPPQTRASRPGREGGGRAVGCEPASVRASPSSGAGGDSEADTSRGALVQACTGILYRAAQSRSQSVHRTARRTRTPATASADPTLVVLRLRSKEYLEGVQGARDRGAPPGVAVLRRQLHRSEPVRPSERSWPRPAGSCSGPARGAQLAKAQGGGGTPVDCGACESCLSAPSTRPVSEWEGSGHMQRRSRPSWLGSGMTFTSLPRVRARFRSSTV